jgi:hypothetical protein
VQNTNKFNKVHLNCSIALVRNSSIGLLGVVKIEDDLLKSSVSTCSDLISTPFENVFSLHSFRMAGNRSFKKHYVYKLDQGQLFLVV